MSGTAKKLLPEEIHTPTYRLSRSRLLEVLEGVVNYGPISLNDLHPKVQRSRSATYRALKELEENGWVRRRLGGNRYILTSRMDRLLSAATISFSEMDTLVPLLGRFAMEHNLHVDVAVMQSRTKVVLIESTERGVETGQPISPLFSDLSIAAFYGAIQKNVVRITSIHAAAQSCDDKADLTLGCFRDRYKKLKSEGVLADDFDMALTISVAKETDFFGSLRIRPKRPDRNSYVALQGDLQNLQELLSGAGF